MLKIQPPNYTQSPNVFFDEIFKELKEGELRVILVIIRQTFGWHKPADKISLSQLSEKTGMERKSVCRSLNSLIEKGLITKKKFGEKGRERCYFSLVIDTSLEPIEKDPEDDITEEEMEIISNSLYQCPKDTPPSVPVTPPPSVPKTPTKETITKENIQKKSSSSSSSSLKNPHSPKPIIDDDDDLGRDGTRKDSIHFTTPRGEKKTISSQEIFKHFLKFPFETKIIQEAIDRFNSTRTPVSNALKYLETICNTIVKEKNSSITKKTDKLNRIDKYEPPKPEDYDKSPRRIGIFPHGRDK